MCLFGQAFVGWGLSSFVGCDGSQHYQLHSLLRDSLHPQDTTPHQKGSTPPQTQIEPRFQQTHPSKQTLITLPSPPHSTPASQSTSSTTSCQSSPLHHSSPSSHASPPPPRSAPPPSADTTVGPRPRRHAVRIRGQFISDDALGSRQQAVRVREQIRHIAIGTVPRGKPNSSHVVGYGFFMEGERRASVTGARYRVQGTRCFRLPREKHRSWHHRFIHGHGVPLCRIDAHAHELLDVRLMHVRRHLRRIGRRN